MSRRIFPSIGVINLIFWVIVFVVVAPFVVLLMFVALPAGLLKARRETAKREEQAVAFRRWLCHQDPTPTFAYTTGRIKREVIEREVLPFIAGRATPMLLERAAALRDPEEARFRWLMANQQPSLRFPKLLLPSATGVATISLADDVLRRARGQSTASDLTDAVERALASITD